MSRKTVLQLTADEARRFFLKHESYCNIDLPKYFSFAELLEKISEEFEGKDLLNDFCLYRGAMSKQDSVNYLIYANKDGKLSWRPLQIIHPLVYVALVHKITKEDNWKKLQTRFKKFRRNKNIKCLSIPIQSDNQQSDKAQQISNWWEQVEQQSILLSLEYDYIFDTDIADCYGSVYTHVIAWSVEGRENAKENRSDGLGNYIDKSIQNAQYGQTNGIPQGSVLMDFIAEIVLGYIDKILSKKLKEQQISEYTILRYRDDYRIFVHNPNDGEKILKLLTEIMMPFGFKLNASKTKGSQDVITQSIKKDKLAWLATPQDNKASLQRQILLIRQHSINYPNSGSLNKALNKFDKKLENIKKIQSIEQLISIVTDIAYHNPKVIPVCCAIISKLLNKLDNHKPIADLVYQKLSRMPNSGFTQIWLQRMLKANLDDYSFSEKMCDLQGISLWNNEWIKGKKILQILENTPIFLQEEFDKLDHVISNSEIDIFDY
ncbi:reverse transcriptase (RNA-dependent DNA polymerase) [Cricetibacter osteomyelitidis]|uniref:Reverse transcriptase (RNA-dependent DNA polymerase) n=1 Tax=Cricetibacter osteomyelitidis TaxID=1521931 RepID=A0A4R2SUT6_9PAST|nr:RNA-directed DNA polymerase [Cricetibacter osteomyelitidis]TCP92094.1 reverse transcriptase (RNA-dependent DNA polymerase) [Cricetibacter osteomyelitidis]